MPADARRGALAVLRAEPQFRLFFLGQALSVIGDRIAPVAIAFAVLDDLNGIAGPARHRRRGGHDPVRRVRASPPASGATAGRGCGSWSRPTSCGWSSQAVAGVLLLAGHAEVWQLAVLAAVYGTADSFFMPAINGLMPQVVAPPHLQQANALRGVMQSSGLVFGPVDRGRAHRRRQPGDGAARRRRDVRGQRRLPGAAAPAGRAARRRRAAPSPRTGSSPSCAAAGARSARGRGSGSCSIAMSVYHLVVLPSIFVLGPVLADRELDGASSWAIIVAAFGAGSIAGNVLLLRVHPRRPVHVAALCLMVASCQAAIIGSGLGTAGDRRARGADRRRGERVLHALGDRAAAAHPAHA